jgi:hypothetical protein
MSRVDAFGVRIGAYSACIMGCAGNLVGLSNTIESRGVTVDGVLTLQVCTRKWTTVIPNGTEWILSTILPTPTLSFVVPCHCLCFK